MPVRICNFSLNYLDGNSPQWHYKVCTRSVFSDNDPKITALTAPDLDSLTHLYNNTVSIYTNI